MTHPVFLMSLNCFAGSLGDINSAEYIELEKIAKAARRNINDIVVAKNDNEFEKIVKNENPVIAVKIENKNITGLVITGYNITSLNIIKNLVNLKTLCLITFKISKIEGLSKLVNLITWGRRKIYSSMMICDQNPGKAQKKLSKRRENQVSVKIKYRNNRTVV